MQNNLSHNDHVCTLRWYCFLWFVLFLICVRWKQFISSLHIIERVMMKLARAFGFLVLARQETHWISWINEWIKIHLIILQESPPPNHNHPLHIASLLDCRGTSVSSSTCKQTHLILEYTKGKRGGCVGLRYGNGTYHLLQYVSLCMLLH